MNHRPDSENDQDPAPIKNSDAERVSSGDSGGGPGAGEGDPRPAEGGDAGGGRGPAEGKPSGDRGDKAQS
ncbi:MAG: hypothetical protein WAK93_02605 [Solirubrobacteraceae bacterium]